MRRPSGDHDGSRSSYGPEVTGRRSVPSALTVQICQVLLRYAWNAMRVPSGDHDGCRASIAMSVIGVAVPPAAGIVHSVPSKIDRDRPAVGRQRGGHRRAFVQRHADGARAGLRVDGKGSGEDSRNGQKGAPHRALV